MAKNPTNARLGTYVSRSTTGETYKAYVPAPLPPVPPIDMDRLYKSADQAMKALGGVDALAKMLPDISLFLYMYVCKEALVSSQIEGTQSSLSDLLLFESDETPGVPVDDVEEVSNYIAALNHGLERMKEGFPLSVRLIREMHKILLRGGRGSNKAPGEFRRSQNWIGGIRPSKARFVPPPPEMVDDLMSDLEKFAHNEELKLPALVKAALVHVQFETIHPFLDGNGRLGRLLITLLLCADGVLAQPILYLSLHFKEHRQLYYDLLQDVRIKGDWERWCEFFLDGVTETATQAANDAKKIIDLLEQDRLRISQIGKASKSALKIHDYLLKKPYLSITKAAVALDISVPSTTSTVTKLVEIGLLREITGNSRNRIFAYTAYLDILAVGTEPLAHSN
ncbi:MAG TPA: cell filamentation protein Fic [Rhodospirillaceae bacterium]|nr:cell filamentation protein Fic [Rhodospirillaceae bacterium]